MITIKINNDYSYLYTEDDDLRQKIWKVLRFLSRNRFFNPAYKARKWDGYVNFFNKNNGQFLTGLLVEIKLILTYLNKEYQIIDERNPIDFNVKEVNKDFLKDWTLKGSPVVLKDFQVDLINQALNHKRGIVQAPTASGKTFIMLGILKALPPGTPVLFLGNRKGVVRQFWKQLLKYGFKNVGYFDGKTHEPNLITCAMVQSLPHLERLLPKFKVLMVDEVHMMMSATAIKAYKKLTGCDIRIAISATPFKFTQKKKDKKKSEEGDKVQMYNTKGFFGGVFKTKVTEDGYLSTEYMQENKSLSESLCTFYHINEPQIPHDIYIDAVANGIANSIHFHKVVKGLVNTLKGRTLILVERLSHGDALGQLIPNSLWIQGKDDDETRDYVISKLQESEKDVVAIATKGIFTVAIDVFVHNLINCTGGKAEHDIIQLMGRGLRRGGDKELLNYYDFIFNINNYLLKHSNKRIKILKNEGHEVIIKDEVDFKI